MAAARNEQALAPTKYTKASFGLFTGLYLIVAGTFWWFWRARNTFPRDEKLAIRCVAVGLPLLAIRTAYSLVFQITGDMTWNAARGNSTAYLVMTFLPETAIISASCWTILHISPPPRKKDKKKQQQKESSALVNPSNGSTKNQALAKQARIFKLTGRHSVPNIVCIRVLMAGPE